jgi:hypothetical protein
VTAAFGVLESASVSEIGFVSLHYHKPLMTLIKERKSVSETRVNLYRLMWLSARKAFVEFCRCETSRTAYTVKVS